jgi:hypothetical protein
MGRALSVGLTSPHFKTTSAFRTCEFEKSKDTLHKSPGYNKPLSKVFGSPDSKRKRSTEKKKIGHKRAKKQHDRQPLRTRAGEAGRARDADFFVNSS